MAKKKKLDTSGVKIKGIEPKLVPGTKTGTSQQKQSVQPAYAPKPGEKVREQFQEQQRQRQTGTGDGVSRQDSVGENLAGSKYRSLEGGGKVFTPAPITKHKLTTKEFLFGIDDPNLVQLTSPFTLGGVGNGVNLVKSAAKAGTKLSIGKTQLFLAGKFAKFASNIKSTAQTSTLLTKLASVAKNPAVIASALLGAIGSYPFAGFIKEEALQTLSFGVKSAINSGNIEGAEEALAMQEEILNPNTWQQIISAVPYGNIIAKLKDFYESANIKLSIDTNLVEDLKIQQETGETEDKKWKRRRQEEEAIDKATVDYYNQERKNMIAWENEARAAQRNADAAFWRKEREKQAELERKDREAIAEFWIAYRKEAQKIKDESRPSNLNFGLL